MTETLVHVLDFGVSYRTEKSTFKPRVLRIDFLEKIIYFISKGQIREAFPFSDILSVKTLLAVHENDRSTRYQISLTCRTSPQFVIYLSKPTNIHSLIFIL